MLAVYDFSGAEAVGWKEAACFLVLLAIEFISLWIFINYL